MRWSTIYVLHWSDGEGRDWRVAFATRRAAESTAASLAAFWDQEVAVVEVSAVDMIGGAPLQAPLEIDANGMFVLEDGLGLLSL